MITAVYPGSFDPITNGHIDVARRAANIFGRVIIGVFDKPMKIVTFSLEERVDMAREAVKDIPNIEVKPFYGLTVDFAKEVKANVMVRGLRVSADFEREFDMAMMNRKLSPELELVCFLAKPEYQFLRSSLLKEVARVGGNIEGMVPEHVARALKEKNGNSSI
ncbi:MAG TPA: pantetheine-phosphate adenylyltransferase [Dehalococcoidia bacterium]|nr:pantetheine-phosphate adenylyltransferase [Dehalococcoidia bacterium]